MTKLLLRLFIRTPEATDEKTRFAYGKLAGGTGIACTVSYTHLDVYKRQHSKP